MTVQPMTRLKANALLLLAALIWGSAFVGQSLGMATVGPLSFTALRFALGAAVVAPLAWLEWRKLRADGRSPGWAEAVWIVALGRHEQQTQEESICSGRGQHSRRSFGVIAFHIQQQ